MFSRIIAGSIIILWTTFVASSGVQFAGVNIAGFDFGCSTNGDCDQSNVQPPLGTNGGGDGPGQMAHFAQADKFNIFRLPVGWQYLQDSLGATLNAGNLGTYDQLVQACLKTGAHCIIDIHNYARWNGAIIGQSGGPTNDQFAGLWSQLAQKYAGESKVVMGLMNEPHDMPDINSWTQAVQAAVTAIRTAGATDQLILIPGNSYTAAGSFVSGGSAAALNSVKDSDGTTSKLIFDVHNYFDSDGSGTSSECTTNKIADGFQPLVTFLKSNNRQALVSELGGGSSSQSCLTDICQALDFLNANSDVYLGWVGWAAGSFSSSYPLSLLPLGPQGPDVPLVTQCFAGKFQGGSGNGNSTIIGTNSTGTTNPGSNGNGSGTQPGSGTGSTGQAPTASLMQPPFPISSTGPLATGTGQPYSNGTGTYQPQQSPADGSGSECQAPISISTSVAVRRRARDRRRAALKPKMNIAEQKTWE